MIDIPKSSAVILEENEIELLWSKTIKRFSQNTGIEVSHLKIQSAKEFWRDDSLKSKFLYNFLKITAFENCKIYIDSNIEKGILPISETYIRNHLITKKAKSFQYGYLDRIVFYINGNKKENWAEFFAHHNIRAKDGSDDKVDLPLPPGLKYLEGSWVSYNGNLEDGMFAQCLYKFYIENNRMFVDREAYSSEVSYHGEAYLQDDSSYLFYLKGKIRGKYKFVIADTEKVNPDILTCIGSAFSIKTGNPIIVKEILIRLPASIKPVLAGGAIVSHSELEKKLSIYFPKTDSENLLNEITSFLGNDEVPFFSLDDLRRVKKAHLKQIKDEESFTPIKYKKQSVYINFSKLQATTKLYTREIVKYYKQGNTKYGIKTPVDVFDEYTYMKICQYNKEGFIKHKIHFEAEDSEGIVDVQSLFPIVDDDSDNDMREPSLRYSNLIMDAYNDTFVSTATFINDFRKSKRVSISYDELTSLSEIIIDFNSIENFEELSISISKISYHFNDPDGKGMNFIDVIPLKKGIKGGTLTMVDKVNKRINLTENIDIDVDNPKIFAFKINFEVMKDDYLYIHFNLS